MMKKRIMAFMTVVVMLMGMIPGSIFATSDSQIYGTVSGLIEGITISDTGALVEATYAGTLQWVKADSSIGRNNDGWWAGIKVTAPENYNAEKAAFKRGETVTEFKSAKDGDNYIGLWGLVTPEYLQAACQDDGLSTYTWYFDWDGDETFEQTVKLHIDAENTVLMEKEAVKYTYTYGTVEKISDGVTVSGSDAVVEATYAGTLQWVKADSSIGRNNDGWWAGIRVTAPEHYNAEKATFKRGETVTEFKKAKDGDNYIELWGLVTPEYLQAACQDDGLSTYTWYFDWNGNGTYEQTVKLHIDAENTILMEKEAVKYTYTYGTVEKISDGVTVSGSDAVVEATYAGTLQWVKADSSIGRNNDGWWAGIRVTAPEHYNAEKATFKRGETVTEFKKAKDGDNYIELWGLTTPEYLQTAMADDGLSTYTWYFDWDGNGTYEQTVKLHMDADQITLIKDGLQQYPSNLGNVSCYTGTDVDISKNGTGNVSVTINEAELTWSAADDNLGRKAGWYVGIKVTVPEALQNVDSENTLKKIQFQVKGYSDDAWDEKPKSFFEYRDSATAPHYIQLWFKLTPNLLQNGRPITMCYRFNWDGEGDYDQYIDFSVNCSDKIVLKMDGTEPTIENVKAYVDTDGNTKVFVTAQSVHGIANVLVDDKEAALIDGIYTASQDGGKESVTIKVTDIYGNITTDDFNVQPKLTAELKASEAFCKVDGTYYYNEDNLLTFTVNANGDDGDYKVEKAVLERTDQVAVTLIPDKNGIISYTVKENCNLSGLKVVITDAAGRTAKSELSGTYIYDTEVPIVTVTPSENITGFYTQGGDAYAVLDNPIQLKKNPVTVSFTVTVEDLSLNPNSYEGWTIDGNTATKIFSASVADHTNGQVDLSFTAVDLCGHKAGDTVISLGEGKPSLTLTANEGVFNTAIHIDRRTPGTNNASAVPEISLKILSGTSKNGIFNRDTEIYAALADNGSGIASVTYSIQDAGGAVVEKDEVAPEKRDGRYVIPVDIMDGNESNQAKLILIVTDNVGNSYEYNRAFSVDMKDPEITLSDGNISTSDQIAYYQKEAVFQFEVTDLSAYELAWKLNDGANGKFLNLNTVGETAYVTVKDGAVNEMNATLTVTATDAHGHISDTYSVSFAFDNKTPEVTVTMDAKDYVQSANGVDYFSNDVPYKISVSDRFMEGEENVLNVLAVYEDGSSEIVLLNRTPGTNGAFTAMDRFDGSFKVTDGKVLTDIQLLIADNTGNRANQVTAVVTGDKTVSLQFAEKVEKLQMVSNKVAVDKTAPEVTVTTDTKDYVQTKNNVDYFDQEVTYYVTVTDQFMKEGTYTLDVKAFFEDGTTEVVELRRDEEATNQDVGDTDTFIGSFTVTDGKVLKDIQILVKDAAKWNPELIQTIVMLDAEESDAVILTFAENDEQVFYCTSNDVVVDMTAPEVTVTTDAKDYVQTYYDVDYFAQEVTYYITVADQFMEDDAYTLEAKAFYEGIAEPETVEFRRDEEITQQNIGDMDAFVGSFTVTDGKVLTDIQILVKDAAKWNPELIQTIVMLDAEEAAPVILTFAENNEQVFCRTSNHICVDMTAPEVEISFSENVTGYYYHGEGEHTYFAKVTPAVEGEGNQSQTGEKTVGMTVTIRDANITLDIQSAYYIANLLENTNIQWSTAREESGETAITYYTSIVVPDDTTAELPFELQIYDMAGNAAQEVSLTAKNNETLPGFAEPVVETVDQKSIVTVGDTIILDCRRATSVGQEIPDVTLNMPDTIYTASNGNKLYNDDVVFKLYVMDIDWVDPPKNANSSGISSIEWKISNAEDYLAASQGGTTYENYVWFVDYVIPVDIAGVGECNEVTLVITVTDNVGNKITKKYVFALDNQSPRIQVDYNDPAGNSPYFRETRVATITVTDINFNADATTVYVQPNTKRNVNWEPVDGSYVGTVTYDREGNYEFSMTTTDLGDNTTITDKDTPSDPEGRVTFGENDPANATHVFTIDKTAPVISVNYSPANPVDIDDEDVEYFNTDRSVEVTITDANFTDEQTVVAAGSQSWMHPYGGQNNRYRTVFGEGNNYQVEVTSTDKAGNVAIPYKGTPFSVDLTAPTIEITTGTMNNEGLNIVQSDLVLGFTVNDSNSNLKDFNITMKHLNGQFETVKVSGEEYYTLSNVGDRTTGYVDITNIAKEKAKDGIYIIQVTALDYAGHSVSLSPEMYLSLNRFGSSFVVSDEYTKSFFTGAKNSVIFRNEVEKNLMILEINPNAVWQNGEKQGQEGSVITMAFNGNAKELIPGTNYSVKTEKKGEGSNAWYMYTYEIFKDNFYTDGQLVDGRYKLLFYSEDAAGNKNANETNADSNLTTYDDGSTAGSAEFVLDHQEPVVAVIGISSGQEISEDNQIVEITIADNTATSIMAYIDDIAIELSEYSENMPIDKAWLVYNEQTGKYMLNVTKSNSRQDVKFVVTDAAGNVTEYVVDRVLVTKNVLVQYFNNVPALCITVVVLIAAAVSVVILLRKKKKES